MTRESYHKQLVLQRIEAHRATFKLETRIFRAEFDGRVRPIRQILGVGKRVLPILSGVRSLLSRIIPRKSRDR